MYLWARIACFIVSAISLLGLWIPFVAFGFLIMLILVTVFHPYKSPAFNTVETILFFVMVFILVSAMAHVISDYIVHHFQKMLDVIGSIFAIVPFIYVLAVLLYRLLFHNYCVQKVYRKFKTCLLCYCKDSITHADLQESLPDRMAYDRPEENTALLHVPV